jgi:hypothetical protein
MVEGRTTMKVALLAVLGLILGALGGAALGIGLGIAWSEFFKSVSTQDSAAAGALVFLAFMPLGAIVGAIGGAVLFAVIALRDIEIQIEREPERN